MKYERLFIGDYPIYRCPWCLSEFLTQVRLGTHVIVMHNSPLIIQEESG